MEHLRLPHQHRHRAAFPAVYWDLIAQKSVQAAEAKCGTAVEHNEGVGNPTCCGPSPLLQPRLQSYYELEHTLTKRIVLVAGNHVTGSRHSDIFRNVWGEVAVCVMPTLLRQAYGLDRGQDWSFWSAAW